MPDTHIENPCRVCKNSDWPGDVQFITDDAGNIWAEYCPNGCYHTIYDLNTIRNGEIAHTTAMPSTLSREEIEAEVAIKQIG